jgi:membrane protease subunit (stomatin/prohibitin family)
MEARKRCSNMNHGRMNAPVKFCPSCGETVNAAIQTRCDLKKHAEQRKARGKFCVDCGKAL